MPNAISFSLFGYNKAQDNGFSFSSYMRGLTMNIKMAELIFPNWKVHVTLDEGTYNHFKGYFDYHTKGGKIDIDVVPLQDLCMMMLHRMKPIFCGKYDRVICRDTDSLLSYKERQAVEYWISTGRVAHAMTDSISHTIPLMGGMVGFTCNEFKSMIGCDSFDKMVEMGSGIDYRIKGADQDFLNVYVLPKIQSSIVEHYLLGVKQSFRGECYNYIQDIVVPDVLPMIREESNNLSYHLGAAGFRMDAAVLFCDKYLSKEQKDYYALIEDKYKEIHYWRNGI